MPERSSQFDSYGTNPVNTRSGFGGETKPQITPEIRAQNPEFAARVKTPEELRQQYSQDCLTSSKIARDPLIICEHLTEQYGHLTLAEKLGLRISSLGLSTKIQTALSSKQIETVKDLLHCRREELLEIANFGEKSLVEVLQRVSALKLPKK